MTLKGLGSAFLTVLMIIVIQGLTKIFGHGMLILIPIILFALFLVINNKKGVGQAGKESLSPEQRKKHEARIAELKNEINSSKKN
jgi:hypothetical protein